MPPYGAQADAVRRFYERTGPDEPVRWRRICRHLVACSRNARYLMAFRRRGVVLKVQRTDTFIETRQDSRRGPEDRHVTGHCGFLHRIPAPRPAALDAPAEDNPRERPNRPFNALLIACALMPSSRAAWL